MKVRLSILVVTMLACASARGAMVIDDFEAARNDRFANNASFLLNEFDLSGVARADDNGRWATMISREYFLSASHLSPLVGSRLTFHTNNDPSGSAHPRMVVSGQVVNGSDLWLGKIDAPVPASVTTYPIAPPGDYGNEIVYNVGISATPKYGAENTTNMAVGRNVLALDFGTLNVNGRPTKAMGYFDDRTEGDLDGMDDPGPNPLDEDETYLQGGDSGGPTFLVLNGELNLFGIHSFIAKVSTEPPHDTFERNASGDIELPFYRQTVHQLAQIPEPSASILFGFLLFLFCSMRVMNTALGRSRRRTARCG